MPSDAYTSSATNGKIIWINDVGNTDVDAIVDSGASPFRTITITSTRVVGGGEPTGMNWTDTCIGLNW